ncbi:pentapeptide repeat-containing protein [Actinokineospora spheciospongiae]|uniref:pentapeptide repeat-containing protein n=1 Tax=Actinokineospora spheciospongiae TaxID=909613 RepID=UPI000D712151|nr:pentapeptide repeat-containing protein [Actinokineospora spheciospongiae]PWW60467.1 uncharacterized protein YjbI with pentapeptide repeats [Actinokineospora spheciospongiae]
MSRKKKKSALRAALRMCHRVLSRFQGPVFGFLFAALLGIAAIGLLLEPVSQSVGGDTVRSIADPAQRASAINSVRQTLLGSAAGLITLLGLLATLRTYLLSRRAQYSERYMKSIALLGAKALDERIGGIFALEQVARQHPPDRIAVMNVLTAFVRRRSAMHHEDGALDAAPSAPNDPEPRERADVQAALTVLGRRNQHPDEDPLDLSDLDLRMLKLPESNLCNADLSYTRLERADLSGANLVDANLTGAKLNHVNLRYADLRGVNATGADFECADFERANLIGMVTTAATMRRARFTSSKFDDRELEKADIEGAKFSNPPAKPPR